MSDYENFINMLTNSWTTFGVCVSDSGERFVLFNSSNKQCPVLMAHFTDANSLIDIDCAEGYNTIQEFLYE